MQTHGADGVRAANATRFSLNLIKCPCSPDIFDTPYLAIRHSSIWSPCVIQCHLESDSYPGVTKCHCASPIAARPNH